MIRTRNDLDKWTRNSDLVPYMLMKKVLNEMISLDARSSTRLGLIILYIQTINKHWENRVLFATNDGKLGCASNKILQGDLLEATAHFAIEHMIIMVGATVNSLCDY